jgi:putative component of membrane protein insertase Oxa1/YidC/SpoIIIJ protein YidD
VPGACSLPLPAWDQQNTLERLGAHHITWTSGGFWGNGTRVHGSLPLPAWDHKIGSSCERHLSRGNGEFDLSSSNFGPRGNTFTATCSKYPFPVVTLNSLSRGNGEFDLSSSNFGPRGNTFTATCSKYPFPVVALNSLSRGNGESTESKSLSALNIALNHRSSSDFCPRGNTFTVTYPLPVA